MDNGLFHECKVEVKALFEAVRFTKRTSRENRHELRR